MTDPTSISVRFMNNVEDHVKAGLVLYNRGVLAKIDKVIAVLVFGFGIYCVTVAGLHWRTLIWFPLSVMEWFNLLGPSRWKARIDFRRHPKFREEYHLTFSPQNIHFKTESLDSVLQWSHYESVIESPTFFLLMYGKGMYTLIPKRCFASAGEMSAFRALVDRTITSKVPASA